MKPTPLELTEKLEQLRAMENGVVIRAAVRKVESIAVDVPADVKKVEVLKKETKKTQFSKVFDCEETV